MSRARTRDEDRLTPDEAMKELAGEDSLIGDIAELYVQSSSDGSNE
jgi:hypothetical protein